ncbi:integrase [Devosia sp. Root413D1]|uniref:tyrosine-type recombinase/integrase n=1 Tax=Devosia sp. Root413D1 TaxID=1736531 RepID=UPI0006FD21F5|nr:site-specific integrase [Devosia sp. Root413D1]KQW75638.1 integrase [Devosia sp. Root413D1]
MSVRKRKWTSKGVEHEAWVVDYVDGAGARRLKTFSKKKEADAFSAASKVEIRDGVHVADSASVAVKEAGRLWLSTVGKAGREQSTLDQYRQHLELHIVPFIGDTKLNALTLPAVRAFEDGLRDDGRSAAMVRKVLVSLGSLLADAQERGLVARNVVRERGRRRKADARQEQRAKGRLRAGIDFPLPSEIKALVAHLAGRWRPLLLTAIFTGLRASELRGLTWSALDLEGKVLKVHQRADRYNAIGRPKSAAGDREVPMPPIVANALKEWRLACPRADTGKKDADGQPIKELRLAFPNTIGKVESLANIINRGLIPTQLAAGIAHDIGKVDEDGQPVLVAKYTGMHSLRHFYASWCINRRADGGLELPAKVVQERLGHSTIAMTMDVYGHLFPRGDDGQELAAAEAALLA